MNEKLLHYIWQFQLLHQNDLRTTDDCPLRIVSPGQLNSNQGPDFLNGRIVIGDTLWIGHVEIHVKTSDWEAHRHSEDENYCNVILHVVWQHDKNIHLKFPTLVLQPLVPGMLIHRYRKMMENPSFIPCESNAILSKPLIFGKWKERLVIERLHQKSERVFELLKKSNGDWEEVCWWLTARDFGGQVNGESFESIAQSLPLSIIHRHSESDMAVEAMLFGQSGMLHHKSKEIYPITLYREYIHYRKKYGLRQPPVSVHFLRMRPANFPTVKLAQLAAFITGEKKLMRRIIDEHDISRFSDLFGCTVSGYWTTHYRFDEPTTPKEKNIGKKNMNRFLINVATVLCYAYGSYHHLNKLVEKAVSWLEMLEAEDNTIINSFARYGLPSQDAFDTQALVQLKKYYCDSKRCLECAIGNEILKDAGSMEYETKTSHM